MSQYIGLGGQNGVYRNVRYEPILDKRRNTWEWANAVRPDLVIWVGPMLWTAPAFTSGANDVSGLLQAQASWEYPIAMIHGGVTGGFHVCGTVRFNGIPQSNVVMQMFRTSDDLYLGEARSGQSGEYVVTSQFNAAAYIVGYLTGSPDRTGATVNTLIPTAARVI